MEPKEMKLENDETKLNHSKSNSEQEEVLT
jgi:hypothetical protein